MGAEGGFFGTALSVALYKGHEEVVRLLLEKEADADAGGGFARREASTRGHEAVMRLLLKSKADVNLSIQYHDDCEAFQEISFDDHETVIKSLLENAMRKSFLDSVKFRDRRY